MKPSWNSKEWLENKLARRGIYYVRLSRKEIWENTLAIIRAGGYVRSDGTEVEITGEDEMLSGTVVYSKPFNVASAPVFGSTVTWVENSDCLFLSRKLSAMGFNPVVLSFAKLEKPNFDVEKGVNGQEQDICRRTNVSKSLAQCYNAEWADLMGVANKGNAYPLDGRYGCVYSPAVTVFRTPEFYGSSLLDEPFKTAVISCAAVDKRNMACTEEEYISIVRDRMRTIFRAGLAGGHDALVLGAWGCGSFGNSPEMTAGLFKKISEEPEFRHRYRAIVFACAAKPTRNPFRGKLAPFYSVFGVETHESVDLGLPSGTKWATCNVGAVCPEEDGAYYDWGGLMSGVVHDEDYYDDVLGEDDNVAYNLPEEYDAARQLWGSPWRIPSSSDFEELFDNCKAEACTLNGALGVSLTGPNGSRLFLPTGRFWDCEYRTSTPSGNMTGCDIYTFYLEPDSDDPEDNDPGILDHMDFEGMHMVRPVISSPMKKNKIRILSKRCIIHRSRIFIV